MVEESEQARQKLLGPTALKLFLVFRSRRRCAATSISPDGLLFLVLFLPSLPAPPLLHVMRGICASVFSTRAAVAVTEGMAGADTTRAVPVAALGVLVRHLLFAEPDKGAFAPRFTSIPGEFGRIGRNSYRIGEVGSFKSLSANNANGRRVETRTRTGKARAGQLTTRESAARSRSRRDAIGLPVDVISLNFSTFTSSSPLDVLTALASSRSRAAAREERICTEIARVVRGVHILVLGFGVKTRELISGLGSSVFLVAFISVPICILSILRFGRVSLKS